MNRPRLIDHRIKKSAKDFQRFVKPFLEKHLDGTITQIEDKAELSQIIKQFDVNGIDAFLLNTKSTIQGIASRIVYGRDYHSFTVRYSYFDKKNKKDNFDCEFSKKLEALRHPENFSFFPYYTVQANCNDEKLCYAYLVETTKLISFIEAIKVIQNWLAIISIIKVGPNFISVEAAH